MTVFEKECGVILNQSNKALYYGTGTSSSMPFPEGLIWDLHKASPGCIYKICHSHPDGLSGPSARDIYMLKAWCYALYPFPARLSVVSRTSSESNLFQEKVFIAQLEPRDIWIERGKGLRKIHIFEEYTTLIGFNQDIIISWEEWIIRNSYKKGEL